MTYPVTLKRAQSSERAPLRDQVQSLVRGLSVIRAFDGEAQLTLSGVAQRAGLTRAAARRFILTLVELGYIKADGRDFRLTPRALNLGYSYLSSHSIPEVALPHVETLVTSVEDSSEMGMLDGHDVVYVLRVGGPRILTAAISIGARRPAHATALGRVLLTGLSPEELEEYLRTVQLRKIQDRTLVDRDQLRKELELVSRQGYALVDQELEEGLRAVAAPIHDRTGRVIASMTLSSHTSRRSMQDLETLLLPQLLNTVREIEIDLRVSGVDLRA
jgi:IclR family pca regulon transcriptional regulator